MDIASGAEKHQGSLSPTIPRLRAAAYNQRSGPEKRSCLLVAPGLLACQDRSVSVETAMAYLYNQVGERRIALSDILFTIDEKLESG